MIVPLTMEHVPQVAHLHCGTLTSFLTDLGERAARAYYTGCVRSGAAIAFVNLEEDKVQGFVLGSLQPSQLKQAILKNNLFSTLFGLLIGVLRHPRTLLFLGKSVFGPEKGGYDASKPELTYLAVSPDCRKRGIGNQLVDAFTQALSNAGCLAYELSVGEENKAARRFYEHYGFQQVGTYREFGKQHHRYRIQVTPRSEGVLS